MRQLPTPKQLRAFVAIAELGSFAAASDQLALSQPAMSATLKTLETGIGGTLLYRSTRRVQLTPEGRQFLPIAKRLLADWEHAFQHLDRLFTLERGTLTIAAMPAYASNLLPSQLALFQQQHPNIDLVIKDVIMESVIDEVHKGHADIGICFEPDGAQPLQFTPLMRDQSIVALPHSSPLCKRKTIAWTDFSGQVFLALNRGSAYRRWTDQALQQHGVKPATIVEANQLTTLIHMVAAGVGYSVIPGVCTPQAQSANLALRSLRDNAITRTIGFCHRPRHALSLPTQAFIAAHANLTWAGAAQQ
jgi:LysR family carnitine catabolism transcriptional activator